MITQTIALLVDAYRELHAKKLFWITMILTVLVVAVCGTAGINEKGITFAGFVLFSSLGEFAVTSENIPPSLFYKNMFLGLGVQVWLTWIAIVLALISTAGIVPDLISSGSIEAILSRPIGRVRLLLTKFAGGLLFTALQVAVFSAGAFLVIGIRGGDWEWSIFLAIPIVTVMFSYLFAFCTLLGIITRSTIAALLLTGLAWGALIIYNRTEETIVAFNATAEVRLERAAASLERAERAARLVLLNEENERREAEGLEPLESLDLTAEQLDERSPILPSRRLDLEEATQAEREWQFWTDLLRYVKAPLPKTSETTALLGRVLIDPEETARVRQPEPTNDDIAVQQEASEAAEAEYESRSLGWILGTSLAFEAFILAIACWIFKRRDF
ncbi:MAG: ABC transporter permease [Planctomycetota bacterium]